MKKSFRVVVFLFILLDYFLILGQNKSNRKVEKEGLSFDFNFLRFQLKPGAFDLISNGDFLEYDSLCFSLHSVVQPCPDPFNSGCIHSWRASHGSPELSTNDHSGILGAVKANGYNWGEGIFQNLDHPMDSGHWYLLCLDFQNLSETFSDSSFLDIQFTNQDFHPGTCFEMLPQPGWQIFGSPFKAGQVFSSIAICFKAKESYRKIWFSHINDGDSVSWIKIQNIHLYKVEDISSLSLLDNSGCEACRYGFQNFLTERPYAGGQTRIYTTNPVGAFACDLTSESGNDFMVLDITEEGESPVLRNIYMRDHFNMLPDLLNLKSGTYIFKLSLNHKTFERRFTFLKE